MKTFQETVPNSFSIGDGNCLNTSTAEFGSIMALVSIPMKAKKIIFRGRAFYHIRVTEKCIRPGARLQRCALTSEDVQERLRIASNEGVIRFVSFR